MSTIWGHSSAGRAPAWHAGGQRFESAWLHKDFEAIAAELGGFIARVNDWINIDKSITRAFLAL